MPFRSWCLLLLVGAASGAPTVRLWLRGCESDGSPRPRFFAIPALFPEQAGAALRMTDSVHCPPSNLQSPQPLRVVPFLDRRAGGDLLDALVADELVHHYARRYCGGGPSISMSCFAA